MILPRALLLLFCGLSAVDARPTGIGHGRFMAAGNPALQSANIHPYSREASGVYSGGLVYKGEDVRGSAFEEGNSERQAEP
ncbi:hypothetical protein B0H13DRAFT_2051655, partial [Mycena leptocephala]